MKLIQTQLFGALPLSGVSSEQSRAVKAKKDKIRNSKKNSYVKR